ncbi:uncharacterized protein OCT59_001604 [Rhizophagus irregularis]|nr:hypothetical protein OCT59_001604 [Rhizophagus irregularis]GBC41415.2 hypothetical protein GLOIN_2v1730032 [Rhizophagus irregularis DAOM 181602=DAOM 197198]
MREVDANVMWIDNNKLDNIENSKEVIVNMGAVIQKGNELSLYGFFGFELILKNSDVDKFSFEGKLRSVKSERKVYVIAPIIVIIILPCNIKIELRTDVDIIAWLFSYSKIGSVQRELDDKQYIYLSFINTLLELKNVKMLVKDDKAGMQRIIQDVKIPAIKKELVSCKETIEEVVIITSNLLVNEYALRWNYIPIEGSLDHGLKN